MDTMLFVLLCRQRFEDRITSRLESGLAAISSMLILLGTSWQSLVSRVQGSDYRALESFAWLQQSDRIGRDSEHITPGSVASPRLYYYSSWTRPRRTRIIKSHLLLRSGEVPPPDNTQAPLR